MSSEEFSENLNDVERTLRSLRPVSPQLDRDRLMFLAGQAAAPAAVRAHHSGARARVFWPSAAAAMTLVSLGLGLTLVLRPPMVVERVVQVAVPRHAELDDAPRQPRTGPAEPTASGADGITTKAAAIAAVSTGGGGQYLRLRDQAIAHGVDFVGSLRPVTRSKSAPESRDSRQELLDQMLHRQESDRPSVPSPLLNLLLNLGEET